MSKRTLDSKELTFGPSFLSDNSVKFKLWAPDVENVKLCLKKGLEVKEFEMQKDEDGFYTKIFEGISEGDLYCYRINDELNVPDPVSRCQEDDVHGFSKLSKPSGFNWENDINWKGKDWNESIIYELHVGTFTKEGTFKAIEEKLDYLISLGITAIELMPVADFPGNRNWGYDGVLIYAPDRSYGTPQELKSLIRKAHEKGLMVFLDVVYNHFGPDGNYLYVYAKSKFFNPEIKTPWGEAINFENEYVRKFFIENAVYWLKEYHFDGLRFDAIHEFYDNTSPDFLEEMISTIKKEINPERQIHLVLEDDKNRARYLKDYTAQWNDDFHHCIHILSTGEKNGYYEDYTEEKTSKSPILHIIKTLTEGYAYQGEYSFYRNELRGEKSSHLPLTKFVNFIQNHDQVGNRALGERISILSDTKLIKASVCLYLLAPSIPLLFMGEEFNSENPFYFFCDLNQELSNSIREGRIKEFSRFPEFSDKKTLEQIPDPTAESTFLKSKLSWEELNKQKHQEILNFYKLLIAIRKQNVVPLINKINSRETKVLTNQAFCVTWITDNSRLILFANFGNLPVGLDSDIKEENIIAISNPEAKNEILSNNTILGQTVFWTIS